MPKISNFRLDIRKILDKIPRKQKQKQMNQLVKSNVI